LKASVAYCKNLDGLIHVFQEILA
jgi:hypothetical protein